MTVFVDGIAITLQVPWRAATVGSGFLHQRRNIGVNMQAVIREDDIAYRIFGTGDAVPSHTRIHGSRNLLGCEDRKQEGPSISSGIQHVSEAQSGRFFEHSADAILAFPHARQGRRKFAELDAQDSSTKFVQSVTASPAE